jgi:hypothetical protein
MTWLNRTAYSGAELQFVTAQQLLYRRQDAGVPGIASKLGSLPELI